MDNKINEKVVVLDFGGQYTHLIANRIRRLGVYSEILPCDTPAAGLACYKGIILSGGPHSVLDPGGPKCDPALLDIGVPVLGLCYGHQLIAKTLGGSVGRGTFREYGRATMKIAGTTALFQGLDKEEQIWMSHGDAVEVLPEGFRVFGSTSDCESAAVGDPGRNIYGLQFHPEVTDTPHGMAILGNFLDICGCKRTWNPAAFQEEIADSIRSACGSRRVFLLVSGGVDSTVAFALLNKVLGPDRVLGLHIDNGLMRQGESAAILDYLTAHGFGNLKVVDASERFLTALAGVSDPEEKRKIIGNMFIEVKEHAFAQMGLNPDEWVLAQGTIYPDTIESAGTKHADRIKTHHNRVDLILELIARGQVIEPLAHLYKDEIRELGESLGLPHKLVWRHPFPGPGLGVRVLCSDGTCDALDTGDEQCVKQIASDAGYGATVLPVRSVGVQGDGRTYAHPVLLTGRLDWKVLEELSTKITNTVQTVNRVVFGVRVSGGARYRLVPGYVTRDRLDKLRAIDHVVTEELHRSGEYDIIWQMPVVLLPVVNEAGDQCVVLRPIKSQEAMTARLVPLKAETLGSILERARSIAGLGDIFFDITHKPPATIEWE